MPAPPIAPAVRVRAAIVAAGLAVGLAGCGDDLIRCDTQLFGKPNALTGLTAAQCKPSCACEGSTWVEPTYTDADIDGLLAWTLVAPPAPLTSDPYAAPPPPADETQVCAVVVEDRATLRYHLNTYASETDARADGAIPTHYGPCGLCSSLTDLAAYMRNLDLTAPVRACGLMYPSGPAADNIACLRALGFTEPCADIWYYNTVNTRMACLTECLLALDKPYQEPDGSLNACLQCDEDQSGPVFKAVAGRTRRNTGVANALCRPCNEVQHLVHQY